MTQPIQSKTILLVDDEADIRDVLEISLTDMGYHVLTAKNGIEALKIFDDEAPPLVMTDIKMPEMDGIELLRRIKHENPETEVIMITGHGDMDLAVRSLKYEATDFITKPINVDGLEVAVKRACDRIYLRKKLREYTQNLERLIQEKTELQDRLSSLGLMIGSISHGIKGLLAGLDGGMYLMDSAFRKEDLSQLKEGWEVVKLTVDRIRKMANDILYYAKERDLQWEKVDPLKLAREVAMVAEQKTQMIGITFVRSFDSVVTMTEMDPAAVHSALVNIIENAIDACIRDRGKEQHTVEFGLQESEKELIFTVKDNGIGMDAETGEKIFDLFYSSKGDRGTGLGLFISNKIIGQHGGSIAVNTMPGKGAKFSIRVPLKLPEHIDRRDNPK